MNEFIFISFSTFWICILELQPGLNELKIRTVLIRNGLGRSSCETVLRSGKLLSAIIVIVIITSPHLGLDIY